jgi:hypothetical protein
VDWGNANLVIPATYAGLYINVEARTTGSDEALGGWDINPYGAGSLSWYAPIGGGILHIEDSVGPSNLPLGARVNALVGTVAIGSSRCALTRLTALSRGQRLLTVRTARSPLIQRVIRSQGPFRTRSQDCSLER